MPNRPESHTDCPLAETFEIVGGKWKGAIIFHLAGGTRRFGELRRLIPEVSQKMLTQQLRALERDGLVRRQLFPEIPPRVEYSLTELGHSLDDVYCKLTGWLVEQREAIDQARKRYDRDHG
jgi:DNA-binding HxlR family transcriptional regulator